MHTAATTTPCGIAGYSRTGHRKIGNQHAHAHAQAGERELGESQAAIAGRLRAGAYVWKPYSAATP